MNQMIIMGVGLSVLAVLVVGVLVGRKIDGDSTNYLVAGRSLPLLLVTCSLTAAAVDSNAIVGNTDLTASAGFWAGCSLAIGLAIALLLSGIFFAKRMNAMGLFTLSDFFRVKYGRTVEVLASIVMVFAYILLLSGNMVACGIMLNYFLGIPYDAGVVVAVLLVLTYTIVGGLFSDAYTASIQTALTLIACVTIAVYTFSTFGISWPKGFDAGNLQQLTSNDWGAPVNWATLVSLGIGDIVAIDFQQRIFGARDPKTAQRACFIGAALTAAFGIVFAYVILTAVNALGVTNKQTSYLFAYVSQYCPPIVAVLVLSGIVAASFSTASGAILAMSGVIVRNIGGSRRVVRKGERDPQLFFARIAMIPIGICGILVAILCSQYTGILLVLAFDFMLCCLVPAMVGGLYWRKSSSRAVFWAIIVGLVLRLFFLFTTSTVYSYDNVFCIVPLFSSTSIGIDVFDGWSTFICFGASTLTYGVLCELSPRTEEENAYEREQLAALAVERGEYEQLDAAREGQLAKGSQRAIAVAESSIS